MNETVSAWGLLRKLSWQDACYTFAVLLLTGILLFIVKTVLGRFAEKASPGRRLSILRVVPIVRLLIKLAAVALIIRILVEPSVRNVVTLVAGMGLALAFTLKDYGSSLVAGLVTVMENTYQPGDWIEVDGAYGEVKAIDIRSVHLVTADDTEVIIPHSRMWSASVFNATSGNRSLLCVTNFYLHADHDASVVRQRLEEIAESSSYRKPATPVTVIVLEKPWGTHYRVKGYVRESREQFLFMTDITVRGKEELRNMNILFAQAPYAELGST